MKRFVIVFVLIFGLASSTVIFAQAAVATDTAASSASWKYIAAALAVGLACIGSGIAVGQIGAAAMGAMSENPEVSGKAMPFIGLAEGICLWGFLVALLILVMK
ncbi:MAG: ATP synthase subunit C [Treponema sp.]|nr:ATP synthase subunit C [Treponema sp.]